MKLISSQDFRKTYHKLTEEVMVMVYGHPIGIWKPLYTPTDAHVVDETGKVVEPSEKKETRGS